MGTLAAAASLLLGAGCLTFCGAARVVAFGAGAGAGAVFLPEVGLRAFCFADAARALAFSRWLLISSRIIVCAALATGPAKTWGATP